MKKEDPQEMRKQDAAKYVGCSVRSLENYTSQGRIGVKYERSKTRPVALYSRAELDRLKAELDSTLYAPAVLLAAIEADELKATKGGGEWKIRREALEEYIRKNF